VLYRAKFREVAAAFNAYIIDATQTIEKVAQDIIDILTLKNGEDGARKFQLPNANLITDEQFAKLPLVVEGESKIVRLWGKAPGATNKDLVLIKFKPTVYSWTFNRAGIVSNTLIS